MEAPIRGAFLFHYIEFMSIYKGVPFFSEFSGLGATLPALGFAIGAGVARFQDLFDPGVFNNAAVMVVYVLFWFGHGKPSFPLNSAFRIRKSAEVNGKIISETAGPLK